MKPGKIRTRSTAAKRSDAIKGFLQNLYPQHLASAVMHAATRIRFRPFKNWQVTWFVKKYGVEMEQATVSDPRGYPDFNAFFTRDLKPDARPIGVGNTVISCPADGEISQFGAIRNGRLLQAKGIDYSLEQLLAGRPQLADLFEGGDFLTVYLSPRDYHRVHMPIDGAIRQMVHVPGKLFSVNQATTRVVKDLFARNERVINLFDTVAGPLALIMVGAVFVGSIETVWAGKVTPRRGRGGSAWGDDHDGIGKTTLKRGQEMGRFNMGSTVILLFPGNAVQWDSRLRPGLPVRMGQDIGALTPCT